ncbi:polysaccharide lyase 8 family protein [Streptomyces sp. LP05-1]|uniref:Polysaccharide lyase 8 family protein n=1 Tax=Streptomyces pyxinae TaxID=2970734 RepID=A0ABT2CIV2_9ACTN|nr:polysaccharide lyase 8 family protein [Streptomyces sp. LP05-1]MCS0636631.1 polysaccharide lyase 8 family protein [Streptomyces sp. LP05-1]
MQPRPPSGSSRWSRRRFLATGSSAALGARAAGSWAPPAAVPPPGAGRAPAPQADPADPAVFEELRVRWLTLQLGAGYDPAAEPYAGRLAETGRLAAGYRATMAPTATTLWPGLPFDPPSGITQSYQRLWTMTQAYVQPGTGHTGDRGLLADVVRGLDHLAARIYHPGTTRYGNWWEWQIGSPRLLMDIVAALRPELTGDRIAAATAAVDHFVPDSMLGDYSGTSTGANRVDLCRSVALRGVLGHRPGKLALARDALSPVFPYVTSGDGLYADGSFVQHTWVPYTGTYGQVLLDGLGRLFALLAGSPWAVTDPERQRVLDSVEHAFAPLVHDGLMMDCVSGRAISRGISRNDPRGLLRGDHHHGHAVVAAIALLAESAGPAERERWHGLVKGWIERDTVSPVLTDGQFGTADLARLRAVAGGPAAPAPEPVGHRLFAAMDRAVHRRPRWTASLAMASDRIASYECGNGENPRGWHTGAGLLSWWGPGNGAQYTDWFWPTVDWYRLPGTTVSTRRLPDRAGGEWGEPKPPVRWTGGVSDGEYAAVGQHLRGLGSTLEARKSWFFTDDAVICLGAGITAADGVPVETVVDNRCLGEGGTARLTTGARWAHLEGHGGWLLPGGTAALRTLREDRTGAWRDINGTGSTERRTRRYLTLWLDHGTDPVDAGYAYVLLPGAGRARTAARARDPYRYTVLANTAGRQGIAVRRLGLTAANFWRAGTVGALTVAGAASVLVRRRGRTATVWLAEPPRTGAPVELVWRRPVRRVLGADPSVTVLAAGRELRLRIAPGTACAGHHCSVAL